MYWVQLMELSTVYKGVTIRKTPATLPERSREKVLIERVEDLSNAVKLLLC